ncbi:hypothetical protein B484DRAFT_204145 [Ochromonadaceae sp. CCMP2298]|nr:hypothetical protein B484DRAFT_204145 [Ochromonadaceae sp. CCMP2298]
MERETEHVEEAWVGGGSGAGAAPAPGAPVYVPGGCAEGWTVGKTKCYLFVPQTYSRDACTAFCQSQGALSHAGTQISPVSGGLCAQSKEEAEFLTLHSAYSDSVAGSWLNYDRDASGVWRWGKGCARSGYEQWSAAAPVSAKTFPSWNSAYSLSHYRGASGDWNNADPSSQQHCSCETPRHTPVASCPLGWVQGPEHCYHLDPDYEKAPKKTWGEYRDACADMGADMLCIRSQGEQDFLGGLRSSPRSDYYTLWVGVTGKEGGGYGWEEGCDSTYSNFASSDSVQPHAAFDSAQKSAWAGTGAGHRATCACQLRATASRALALVVPNLPGIYLPAVCSLISVIL